MHLAREIVKLHVPPNRRGRVRAKHSAFMQGLLLVMALTGLCSAGVYADRLIVDVWCDMEPLVFEGGEYPLSTESAARRLLEEARIFFSAMIYGYSFAYTPSDRSRNVAEAFSLTPLAEIVWGDPSMTVLYTRRSGSLLHGRVEYRLADFQQDRRRAWSSNTLPTTAGRGEETLLEGAAAKIASFESSIKQAIREYVSRRVYNKPKSIEGEVLLWESPQTIVKAGAYSTASRIKLFVSDLQAYTVF